MREKKILIAILLLICLCFVFTACEQDKTQMALMNAGYYTLYNNLYTVEDQFDVVEKDSIKWTIEASKGMYEFLLDYEGGEVEDHTFEFVYVIKFESKDKAQEAYPILEDLQKSGKFFIKKSSKLKFTYNVSIQMEGDTIYFGTESAIADAVKLS